MLHSLSGTSWSVELQMRSQPRACRREALGNQAIIKVPSATSGHQQLPGLSERNFIKNKTEILVSDPDVVFLDATN